MMLLLMLQATSQLSLLLLQATCWHLHMLLLQLL